MVNENIVLDYYLQLMDEGKIEFLVNEEEYKREVTRHIRDLLESKTIHKKIEVATELWKLLFEASMSHIERDKRGYDDLFKYFDEYVKFEELIFASDSFYRDHTIHCLWVYFLGEYLYTREEFSFVFKDMFEGYNTAAKLFYDLIPYDILDEDSPTIALMRSLDRLNQCQGALRCLSALTHDLGYPLKKIYKINKSITNILPHFTIYDYQEFDFSFNITQAPVIDKFLELLSIEVSLRLESGKNITKDDMLSEIVDKIYHTEGSKIIKLKEEGLKNLTQGDKDYLKDTKLKGYLIKDVTKYMRYAQDFEQHQHGLLSAYLLVKTLKFFRSMKLSYYEGGELDFSIFDIFKVSAGSVILNAITDHTSEGYQITKINDPSALLTLVDELEEFSRISRANQNRQFINEFCKTDLYAKDGYLCIDFVFDNEEIENLDPELAFKGRCKKMLTLFNISELDQELKIILRCIGRLSHDNNEYKLEIGRKYANITINSVEQDIRKYLKSRQFYTKEGYMRL